MGVISRTQATRIRNCVVWYISNAISKELTALIFRDVMFA